jgi:signal recognition particle subunit SRP54
MFDFLTNKFSSIFSYFTGQKYLSESNITQTMQKVQEALLESDVPYHVVVKFIEEIKSEVIGQKVLSNLKAGEQFAKIVHEKLVAFLGGKIEFDIRPPATVLLMGLQGSGKTTTVAKLAYRLKLQSSAKPVSILVASVDFYRPAAIDQLEILAQQVGVSFYRAHSKDPVSAAQEIVQYGKTHQYDLIFIDTAGRLHVDSGMLEELQRISSHVRPTHTLLVLDAMTGQESLRIAKTFDQVIPFEGVILTKIDSESRAGAAFAFKYELKKPILFLGVGEKKEDLELFRPERIAGRILGMGDVQSLVERANEKIKQTEQEEAQKAFSSGNFTLNDFAKQMEMMNRLGSFSQLVRFMPGMQAQNISADQIERAESEMKRFKAILSSMTFKERLNYKLLNGSRKSRIAKGSGTTVAQVNNLLQRFEQTQQFAKLFKRMGKFPGF